MGKKEVILGFQTKSNNEKEIGGNGQNNFQRIYMYIGRNAEQ